MEEKLKKITFSKSLRGYACDEVDTYLRYVADKYEQRSRECTELRRQMALIAAKMNEYTDGMHKTAEAEDARKKSVQETCDNMIDEAKRQAAHILADAEAEAAVIRRHAEDNAQTIAANAAREGARVVNDAARSVAARNNAADRLVEEIDSFRKEVYSLYSRHIAELDRLAARTDEFYDRKTAVAESVTEDDTADAETSGSGITADTEIPHTEDTVSEGSDSDDAEDSDAPVQNDPPIRIDWKNRTARQTRDLVIDIPDEDEDPSCDEDPSYDNDASYDGKTDDAVAEPYPADDDDKADDGNSALDALFLSLTDKKMLTSEPEAKPADEEPHAAYDFEAEYEEPAADTDGNGYDTDEDADPTGYGYDEPDEDSEAYDDADENADVYDEPEEDPEEYEEYDEEDSDDDDDEDDDTDWLLNNLKAQYAAKPAPTAETKPKQSRANAMPESFDALMNSDTATDPVQDISLTGEFDRIYNKEQTEKYMEEVEKQPLNIPEKPKKPKKHARD